MLPLEQPTLLTGDGALRPWRDEDVNLLGTQAPAGWRAGFAHDQMVSFVVVDRSDTQVGQVEVRLHGDGVAQLSCTVHPPHRRRGHAGAAVRRVLRWCLVDLALARVQAMVEPTNEAAVATAIACGLRPEGVLRGYASASGVRHDMALHAVLATDLEQDEREMRWGAVRAGLPAKRLAAGVLARNRRGEALVLQTSYKTQWEVPGGLVEPDEGLVAATRRELAEELGVALPVGDLLVVDACPASGGLLDIVCLVFDGGVHDDDLLERFTYPDGEIIRAHWAGRGLLRQRCAPRVATRLVAGLDALDSSLLPGAPLVLHDGRPELAGPH